MKAHPGIANERVLLRDSILEAVEDIRLRIEIEILPPLLNTGFASQDS